MNSATTIVNIWNSVQDFLKILSPNSIKSILGHERRFI